MRKSLQAGLSLAGAGALAGSLLTVAWARDARPWSPMVHAHVKHFTVNGSLQINDVLRVQRNNSVYGVIYAHGSEQVWKGLLVRDGLKTDTLNDTGVLQAQSATIANALQAGAMSGASIATTGDGNIGGSLAVAHKISGDGVDGGAGGLSTSGAISGSSLATSGNITDGGTLAVTGGVSMTGGLTVAGSLNLTNATVTGLNLSNVNLNLNGATAASFNVGTPGGTAAPLNISANNRTAVLGVNTSGAVTTDSLATTGGIQAGGDITASGPGGVITGLVQAPTPSGNTQGQLTLQGSTIGLNGTVGITSGDDVNLSLPASNSASHVNANGDTDFAGSVTITAATSAPGSSGFTTNYTFVKPYPREPIVTLTPTSDPANGSGSARWWVTPITNNNGQYTGFTAHLATSNTPSAAYNVTFYYTAVGR